MYVRNSRATSAVLINFIRCHAIQADCDNDNTDDPSAWITPATIADRLPGIAFYAVKSRNCDKVKHPGESGEKSARPRWHYYFPLHQAIPKIHIISSIMGRLLVLFPEFDRDGMKPAQFFFGHPKPDAEYHPGEKDIAQFFVEHPDITESTFSAEAKPAEQQKGITASGGQDDFISMNAPDMLEKIPADDYGIWVDVGMALKAAGADISLWDSWSQTSAKYPGHAAIIQKWNSFKGNGKGPGTLVHLAQQYGWKADPEKLTGEYKASHEAAEAYKAKTSVPDHGVTILPANPDAARPACKAKEQLTVGGYEDVEIKPTDFLFFPWFPRGKLVSVQGDSGSSKSTFMYAVGALVSTGCDLLGSPCEDPGNVMFITIEDDPGDIKTAFMDAGGDLSKLRRIVDRESIAKLNLSPDGAENIDRIIKEHGIKLLVLDPIQQFLIGDMNKANETRPQLSRLMNIAAENNICIVFIEHMGKDTSKAALHRAVGSVDIGASTRSMIQVVTDPVDDYFKIAFTVKNNTADSHDTQRAIRYQVKDHPGSFNPETKKHDRFHGHATFCEILPEYTEQQYRKAMRKAEEAEQAEETLLFEYDDDPLVITARQLISENPQGLFIGTDDFIQKITMVCGHCPYDQTKNKRTGIYARVGKLRSLMIDTDGIQVDTQTNSIWPKAYNWRGTHTEPSHTRTKGFALTPVKARKDGYQQTKI